MAKVRAGDITSVVWYGRNFDVAGGDTNVNIRTGTTSLEVSLNGNGTVHATARRRPPGFSDLPLSIDSERGDLEFLQGKVESGEDGPIVIELANGVQYEGDLFPVGDLDHATGDGTVTVEGRGSNFEKV